MDYYDTASTGSDIMFNIAPIFITICFVIVFGLIIISSIKGISQWSHNSKQPILDVNCKIISKRMDLTRHTSHQDANGHYVGGATSTYYYITFEFESKDRMEFEVSSTQYGVLAQGDFGKLKFQGTLFLDFTRQ